ncbi:MAG TPA: helix-turn-helix domain-containing protein [Stackebrandtia sp.]|jgi:AcrR family transcriptional regulator|uniref:TetR/AcrR family transcriptional regulator n=1 Tax=Stackebrandtia sp. TaxID=2023065 RepID=UPI002D375C61|nr:helix-turn-helix domain-containing protein [Stackebrandtia sp.]HZE37356.1 helix-turn-helix domain-containing protein [Stackebrandtia sp.]
MSTSPAIDVPIAAGLTRADARRNRALVLRAAQRAFAEVGTSVSLGEIARRAGVGAGTVYRHFPTKSELLEAVLHQRIEALTARANALRAAADSGEAFFGFCVEGVLSTARNLALCAVFETGDGWPKAALVAAGRRFREAVDHLLRAAQRDGAVRADVELDDVMAIYNGCVAAQRSAARTGRTRQVAEVMLAGLRATPVTKIPAAANTRDENPARDETARPDGRCAMCGAPLPRTGRGRPARYCTAACRQKAHRRRSRRQPVGA